MNIDWQKELKTPDHPTTGEMHRILEPIADMAQCGIYIFLKQDGGLHIDATTPNLETTVGFLERAKLIILLGNIKVAEVDK